MHIPDGFLNNQTSFSLIAISLVFCGLALKKAKDFLFVKTKVFVPGLMTNTGLAFSQPRFVSRLRWKSRASQKIQQVILVFGFVFAIQMIDFVKINGVPGHLIGSFLAALVLGPWLGLLAMSGVLAAQAIFLADGGILALGVNILNMAVVGCLGSYYLYLGLEKVLNRKNIAIFLTSWLSVMTMIFAYALEAKLAGQSEGVSQLIAVHILVGVAEGLITIIALKYLFAYKVHEK